MCKTIQRQNTVIVEKHALQSLSINLRLTAAWQSESTAVLEARGT
ncbi:MAG: hypothetical protein Q8K59_00820 [Nitrosomonas sp.]|nr:hypothetical protein [Nitrosomonas sp.]